MTTDNSLNTDLGTSEITWNLADLYQNTEDPRVTEDIDWCQTEALAIAEKYSSNIRKLSAKEVLEFVKRLEKLHTRLGKLATFAFLNYTTQIDNAKAGAFFQQIREISSGVEKEIVFFELEWNSLDSQHVNSLLQHVVLADYHHFLKSIRRYQPHQLTEIEEKLLIERKIVDRSSWTTLFEKVIGHLRFGENKRTEEEVLTDLYNSNRDIRSKAAREMTEGLRSQNHILTHVYNTLAAEKMISDRIRNHDSWVSSMNLDNQIQDSTVESLVEAVTGRYDIVSRYYTVKKDLLKLDQLYDYDRYAPLPALPTQRINWEECKRIVLESFHRFSPKMSEIADLFFTDKYIHAPVLPGKRGGAFAHPCIPESHPFVMVNYTGNLRDISTVAHELGHGVHQVLAAEKGYFYSDTPLVLAETASVFAELLVFQSQLNLLSNEDEKRAFICQKLESIFATVFRQTAMNRFEKAMHEGRRQHGELSGEQLNNYWLETQREMFGNSVTLTDQYGIWWSYIPHFLSTPGYVYSYAFGELLVLALYGIYQKDGESFVKKYFTLLAAGGSSTPYDLLQPLNIDLDDKDFWNNGLNLIDDMLKQVE